MVNSLNKKVFSFSSVVLIVLTAFLFLSRYDAIAENVSAKSASNGESRDKLIAELEGLQVPTQSLERALELVAELIKPSVVSITSVKIIKHPNPFSEGNPRGNPHGNPHGKENQFDGGGNQFGPDNFFDFFGEDFFDRFFKDRFPDREFKQQGLGSGVIVDEAGYILTNNHVVEGADEIKVILGDKREFEGKIIGADSQSDVAVIKIEGDNLVAARLGDSEELNVGNWAIAIGNPFGLSQTVSVGVISATGRANIGIAQYEDMIQTDAAINPGNSGGPLVNIKGEVIGINTAIFTRTGGYQGIGFAIPVNMAKVIMKSLIEIGRVARGWLGVVIQDLNPSLIKQFNVSVTEGVLVAEVQGNSPASEGGMETGDIIVKYEGKDIRDVNHLRNVVAQTMIGKEVAVIVLRNGKEMNLNISIKEQPEGLFAIAGSTPDLADIGLTVQNLTDDLAKSLGIEETKGVVVTEVLPGSPAVQADIRVGDLIKEVNREKVSDIAAFKKAVKSAKENNEILFLAKRGDYTRYVILKLGKQNK